MAKEKILYYPTYTPEEILALKNDVLVPALKEWIISSKTTINVNNDGSIYAMAETANKIVTNIKSQNEAFTAAQEAMSKLMGLFQKYNRNNKTIPNFFLNAHHFRTETIPLHSDKRINAYWKVTYKIYFAVREADINKNEKYAETVDSQFSIFVQIYNGASSAMKIVGIDYKMLPAKYRNQIESTKDENPSNIIFYYFDKKRNLITPYYLEPGRKDIEPLNNKSRWTPACRLSRIINGDNTCFCNRNFTEEELKNAVIELRKEAGIYNEDLFNAKNCMMPINQKSYKFLSDQLNLIFGKYEVNTCLRKFHFLAQIFHETDCFKTTLEYEVEKEYKPYNGRGLMQLTWQTNYKAYSYYCQKDYITNYKIVAENLSVGADSGGWFWKQGKILSPAGTIWQPSKDAPSYVKKYNPQYPKTKYKLVSFVEGSSDTIEYGAVDLNLIADDDLVDVISYFVNGGSNGLTERRKYIEIIKNVLNYESCTNKR